jgi:hypothetical protein
MEDESEDLQNEVSVQRKKDKLLGEVRSIIDLEFIYRRSTGVVSQQTEAARNSVTRKRRRDKCET